MGDIFEILKSRTSGLGWSLDRQVGFLKLIVFITFSFGIFSNVLMKICTTMSSRVSKLPYDK